MEVGGALFVNLAVEGLRPIQPGPRQDRVP